LELGTPVSIPAPPALGVEATDADITFEYASPDEGTVRGQVEFTGSASRQNNLVLTIDPLTGEAAIQNESPFFDVAISAYTITSSSGRLRTADGLWNSLQDQGTPGWEQADNVSDSRLTEFNPSTNTSMAGGGAALLLGTPVEISGDPLALDEFTFQFLLSTGEIIDGIVELGPVPETPLTGDYDQNGVVNANDYNRWRAAFGQILSPGTGADGNGDGAVDAADYVVWRANYDNAQTDRLSPVPEPSAGGLFTCLLITLVSIVRFAGRKGLHSYGN
jgi:hypothetical protein